jgi:hypothetical protein
MGAMLVMRVVQGVNDSFGVHPPVQYQEEEKEADCNGFV